MEFTTRLGLHSQATRLLGAALPTNVRDRYGPVTLCGSWPRSRGTWIAVPSAGITSPPNTTFPSCETPKRSAGFGAGLFPFRSPLLRESWAREAYRRRARPSEDRTRSTTTCHHAGERRVRLAHARVTRILVDDGHACDRRPRAYARESPTSTRRRPSRAHSRYARRTADTRSVGTRANAFDDTSAHAEKSRLGPGACVHDYPATTPTKPSAADSARTGAVRRTVDADTRVPRRPCDLIYRGASTRDSFCTAGNRPSDRRGPGLFGHEGRNLRSTCRCSHNLRITRRRAVYEEERNDVSRSPSPFGVAECARARERARHPCVSPRSKKGDRRKKTRANASPFDGPSARLRRTAFESPRARVCVIHGARDKRGGVEASTNEFADHRTRLTSILAAKREIENVNDPSAGSPTETLLRLLLPLNGRVRSSSRVRKSARRPPRRGPKTSLRSFNRPISGERPPASRAPTERPAARTHDRLRAETRRRPRARDDEPPRRRQTRRGRRPTAFGDTGSPVTAERTTPPTRPPTPRTPRTTLPGGDRATTPHASPRAARNPPS
ncbi:hypothetical protein V9T40_010177 [Parthenolecanium corni]|uniref:Uncharacterized protein n=1 Tax=Parthenolecanium corni TaxID=536013 RepID=A0AAN9T2F7_9HEMI